MSPETFREDALFAVEASLPLAMAVALSASRRARALASKAVEFIVNGGKVEDEMNTHPGLTKGEAVAFVKAAKQVREEDSRRLAV